MADTKDPAFAAWCQVQHYVDRLFDATERLDEAGAIEQAAASGQWTPKTLSRALASVDAARAALDELAERMRQMSPAEPSHRQPAIRVVPRSTPATVEVDPNRAPLARRAAQARARVGA